MSDSKRLRTEEANSGTTATRISEGWLMGPSHIILTTGIVGYHLLALLALFPYFFSWTGVVLAALGYLLALPGINLCYHRLLAHRGLSCSKRVEHALALLGVMTSQFGPAYWVAVHRRHHHRVDDRGDPHSPRAGFFWAHMGWLFVASDNSDPRLVMEQYAKDLLNDPFYAKLERGGAWSRLALYSLVLYFSVGAVTAVLTGGTAAEAVQFGSSLVVWGVAVRIVWVWHVTMSVNSVTHTWGYRTHATPDDSRNNPIIGILAFGEGWHNNHHAFPRSARHGHRWWELDLTWVIIKGLSWIGMVKILDVTVPGAIRSNSQA